MGRLSKLRVSRPAELLSPSLSTRTRMSTLSPPSNATFRAVRSYYTPIGQPNHDSTIDPISTLGRVTADAALYGQLYEPSRTRP